MMTLPPFVINKKNDKCLTNPADEQLRGLLSWGPHGLSGAAPCGGRALCSQAAAGHWSRPRPCRVEGRAPCLTVPAAG